MECTIVLNLIINGIPSIPQGKSKTLKSYHLVLNLIINGIPSIRVYNGGTMENCFKF